MKHWKSILAMLAIAISAAIVPNDARANNYQDMWWVGTSESGWGINIAHQGNVIFATWYIYGTNSQPTWIFLSRAERSGAQGNTFTGDIFQATAGSPFSAVPFVPAQVNLRRVGMATLVFSDARTATLTYTFDGVQVVKQLTRLNLDTFNLSGTYFGGLRREGSGCVNAAFNGSLLNQATYSVSHNVSTGSLTITEVGGTLCNFSGNVQAFGSIMEGSGNFSCAAEGITGTWTMREARPSPNALSALLALRPNGESCTLSATIGGLKP